MLYTFTTEVYNTNYRVLGIGWATGMGRLGTCIMPFYLFPLINIDPVYPFYLFTFFCLICAYCTFSNLKYKFLYIKNYFENEI